MHYFSTFFKKKPTFYTIHRSLASQYHEPHHKVRLITTNSNNQSSSISSYSSSPSKLNVEWRCNYDRYKSVESLTSSIVVVGLSLGLCYLTSVSQPSSQFVYADSSHQDQSAKFDDKPMYIFGGMNIYTKLPFRGLNFIYLFIDIFVELIVSFTCVSIDHTFSF